MKKAYSVTWSKRAAKQLQKFPKKQQVLIFAWVAEHLDGCANPREVRGARKLEGTECGWRYRLGSYWLLVSIRDKELVVEVIRVGHRRDVYSRIPKM